jgi:uncharacterized protein YuzE
VPIAPQGADPDPNETLPVAGTPEQSHLQPRNGDEGLVTAALDHVRVMFSFVRPPLWKNKMRLKIDRENDALYFRLDETEIVESEEVQPGVILDFDKDGRVVGMEMLAISTRTQPETLRVLQFETA